MRGTKARSKRRLARAVAQTRELAADLRAQADHMVSGEYGVTVTQEDRETATWLRQLANDLYRGASVLPQPDLRSLERLAYAVAFLDRQTGRLVDELREQQGATWTQIGYALGISDEAARKRYGKAVPSAPA